VRHKTEEQKGSYVHKFVAALVMIATAHAEKNYKDQAEYDMYNAVSQDFTAGNYTKALTDLDAWAQKYPDSEFKEDRQLIYVKSYFELKQFSKALDTAAKLDSTNLELLYMEAASVQQIPSPAPDQLAAGAKAAHELEGSDNDQVKAVSKSALLYIALVPGVEALKAKNCPVAESALKRSLEDYPYSGQAAAYLAEAEVCLYKSQPERISLALYEFARAASLDPASEPRLEDIYRKYHGTDPDGLKQLKDLAVKAPFPPAGFEIKSAGAITREKQAEFEKNNPELVLWMSIKAALTGRDGDQYFTANMKDALVPPLLGVLVEAKPACHPTELRVAIGGEASEPEVLLKLEKPLPGKPEAGSKFRWEAVAVAFTANPFLLTMEAEADKIHGLELMSCTPVPGRKSPTKGKQ
jgi:tetratricopeptide (TPR) repeat protein